MTLLIQALPLLVLVGLLASGRAGRVVACAVAIALSFPAALFALPGGAADLPGFAAGSALQGLYLAFIPVGIMSGGLLFHATTIGPDRADPTPRDRVAVAFDAGFLLGPFTEA